MPYYKILRKRYYVDTESKKIKDILEKETMLKIYAPNTNHAKKIVDFNNRKASNLKGYYFQYQYKGKWLDKK